MYIYAVSSDCKTTYIIFMITILAGYMPNNEESIPNHRFEFSPYIWLTEGSEGVTILCQGIGREAVIVVCHEDNLVCI